MAEAEGPKLVLAGFGASSALQLTVEAPQMAAHIGQVVSLGWPERTRDFLFRHGVTVTPLDDLFAGESFAEGYGAVSQAVLARARTRRPPAGRRFSRSVRPARGIDASRIPREPANHPHQNEGRRGNLRATVTLESFGELLSNIDASSCLFVDIRQKAKAPETARGGCPCHS